MYAISNTTQANVKVLPVGGVPELRTILLAVGKVLNFENMRTLAYQQVLSVDWAHRKTKTAVT